MAEVIGDCISAKIEGKKQFLLDQYKKQHDYGEDFTCLYKPRVRSLGNLFERKRLDSLEKELKTDRKAKMKTLKNEFRNYKILVAPSSESPRKSPKGGVNGNLTERKDFFRQRVEKGMKKRLIQFPTEKSLSKTQRKVKRRQIIQSTRSNGNFSSGVFNIPLLHTMTK